MPPNIHDQLAEDAQEERDTAAKAIVNFLKKKVGALRAYEKKFVEDLDPELVFWGQLAWAEEIARTHGYQDP